MYICKADSTLREHILFLKNLSLANFASDDDSQLSPLDICFPSASAHRSPGSPLRARASRTGTFLFPTHGAQPGVRSSTWLRGRAHKERRGRRRAGTQKVVPTTPAPVSADVASRPPPPGERIPLECASGRPFPVCLPGLARPTSRGARRGVGARGGHGSRGPAAARWGGGSGAQGDGGGPAADPCAAARGRG